METLRHVLAHSAPMPNTLPFQPIHNHRRGIVTVSKHNMAHIFKTLHHLKHNVFRRRQNMHHIVTQSILASICQEFQSISSLCVAHRKLFYAKAGRLRPIGYARKNPPLEFNL